MVNIGGPMIRSGTGSATRFSSVLRFGRLSISGAPSPISCAAPARAGFPEILIVIRRLGRQGVRFDGISML